MCEYWECLCRNRRFVNNIDDKFRIRNVGCVGVLADKEVWMWRLDGLGREGETRPEQMFLPSFGSILFDPISICLEE